MSAAGWPGHIPGGAEVTLRAPPPLDKPLDVVATDGGSWSFAMAPPSSPPDDRRFNLRASRRQVSTRHAQPSC